MTRSGKSFLLINLFSWDKISFLFVILKKTIYCILNKIF